jgi:hypothetical protein
MASWKPDNQPSLFDAALAAHLEGLGIEWGSRGFNAARKAIYAVNHGNYECGIRSGPIVLTANDVCIALRLEDFLIPQRWAECGRRRNAA